MPKAPVTRAFSTKIIGPRSQRPLTG